MQSTICSQTVYVVPDLHIPLLGRPAIKALELVKWIGSVKDKTFDTQKAFPALFQNLGKLQRPYHIQMKEGAKPFALTTLHRVPVPLLPRVKAELERMRQLGVIVPVRGPTDWFSGMVVVPKPQERSWFVWTLHSWIRVYGIRQEHHHLSSVEQTLAELAGAKIFTKLDASSGFWQIPLTPESSCLTTFIIPFGWFLFQ